MKWETLVTAVAFIRVVATVVITVTDPTCWDAASCVLTLELILTTCYIQKQHTSAVDCSIQSNNMSICIAPNKQKSSEVLAAKQMRFELFANVSMESDEVRSSTGSLFHVAGPDTAKLRRPMVVLVPGTTSVPLFVDRSWYLPTTDETAVQTSAR